MAHTYGNDPEMLCHQCGEPLRADGGCQFCDEGWAMEIRFAPRALLVTLALCLSALGQTISSGRGVSAGSFASGAVSGDAPLTYSARTDVCEDGTQTGTGGCTGTQSGQGAALKYLGPSTPNFLPVPGPTGSNIQCGTGNSITQPTDGQYLCGRNSSITDPDFGTVMYRATDYSLSDSGAYPCGNGGLGRSFNLGSGGRLNLWSSDNSKLLISNTGNNSSILAWNTSTMQATPSALCGAVLGDSVGFAVNDPHSVFELNKDHESTVLGSVTSGTFLTPETVYQCSPAPCSSGPHATVQAVKPSTLMQIGHVTGGTPNSSTTWVGNTSGAVFTPSAAPTTYDYANTVYKGTINDSGAPSTWTISWSLLFNLNYVSGMGAPYFPTASNHCLPASYDAAWNGLFINADDDLSFTLVFSDNGQVARVGTASCPHSPGGICTGPTLVTSLRAGNGCRLLDTMTDQVTGDWGPTGQLVNNQANYIPGTVSGTLALQEILTQDTTYAQAQLFCNGSVQSVSGSPSSQFVCSAAASPQILVGVIYGTADASHVWRGASGSFAPTAQPAGAPFYSPDALHESSSEPDYRIANVGLVQQGNGQVAQVQSNTPVAGQTTITLSDNNPPVYNPRQQLLFYGLTGAHDQYMNCGDANHCPFFTVVVGEDDTTKTIVVADTINPNGNYTDSESSAVMAPNGFGENNGYGFFENPNFWQVQTLNIGPTSAPGHAATGQINKYIGKFYTAHNLFQPSLPCSVVGYTPCPGADDSPLLAFSIPVDQHGSYNNHGPADLTPVPMITTNVCGQAGGAGAGPCPASYGAAWWNEIIAAENSVANPSATHCSGAACVYRLGHTFNAGDNWNFNIQNAIGNMSKDGQWVAFPSTWANTLGCMMARRTAGAVILPAGRRRRR